MLATNAPAAIPSPEAARAGQASLPLRFPVSAAIAEDMRRVFVDRGLILRGEFRDCDHLAIAGHVQSDVALQVLDILEPGSFKGSATVAEARIAGRYEGALIVAEKLIVGSAGHISGSVRCGQLQLEDGGKIDGDLCILSNEAKKAATREDDAAPRAPVLDTPPHIKAAEDERAVGSGDAPPSPGAVDAMLVAAAAAENEVLLAKAEAGFRAALKANVFDVAALSGLGHLARQRGDLAGALEYFQQIMAADSESISVRCVSIDILHGLSRHEEAAALEKEVHALRARQSPLQGDTAPEQPAALAAFDEAEAMFKSVLERHPENLGALAGLGHLARRRGDRVAMLKYYTGALALEPMNISLRLEVARALKEQGELALARQILETVPTEHPGTQAAVG